MAYIGNQPAESFTSFATQEFSTSATTSYTLDHAVTNENEIALFVNNVRQQPGSGKAYTATGTALTLSAATASTDTMYCVFLGRALQTVTPATNSITAAMVGNDLISGKDALTSSPADTDEFLVSDAGTLKRIDYSLIKSAGLNKLITTTLGSNASQIDFDSTYITSTYTNYYVVGHLLPVTDNVFLNLRVMTSGTVQSGSSDYGSGAASSGSSAYTTDNAHAQIVMNHTNGGNASGEGVSFFMNLYNPLSTTFSTAVNGICTYENTGGNEEGSFFSGQKRSVEANNGIRFLMSSGDIASGSYVTLYGIS